MRTQIWLAGDVPDRSLGGFIEAKVRTMRSPHVPRRTMGLVVQRA